MSGIQENQKLQSAQDVKVHTGIRKRKYLGDRSGSKNSRWKGGRRVRSDGYILIYSPNHPFADRNTVLEHRLIMEKNLGRYLSSNEIVHHKNHNRSDNRLINLELTTKENHAKQHHLGNHYDTAILDKNLATQIVKEYKSTEINVLQLAKKYSVARTTILDVLHGDDAYYWNPEPIKTRLPTRRKTLKFLLTQENKKNLNSKLVD